MKNERRNKPRDKMSSLKSKALTKSFVEADDLHWTCPKCKSKYMGTMDELMLGCSCG